jgi:threonine synthase
VTSDPSTPTLWPGVISAYRRWLPVREETPAISLGEGGTPLIRSPWLSELTGCSVWLKVEGDNPTGSFKDRGMTVAVSVAVEQGATAVVCASTGNTSASMTAYAARARLKPLVLVPHGKIARGKLAQAVMHGARLLAVRGGFDACLDVARALAKDYPVGLMNSVNPYRLEGQKTAAFEIIDALAGSPDVHVLPVGNAGNITAYWKGFCEYADAGRTVGRPALWGFQASGAAPLVEGGVVREPETVATAIRIGNPASWLSAEAARDESGGIIEAVSDEQILRAQADLAARDGVFVEPASAAGIAGLFAMAAAGRVDGGQTITVTVTGHGLKDIETAMQAREPIAQTVIEPDVDAAAEAAGLC